MNQYSLSLPLPQPLSKLATIILISACAHASSAYAAPASERTHLEMMIRQLNALEDTARRSGSIAHEPGKRYFFDYPRFADDIERVRLGIEGYLTPNRAQPRDPVEMSDTYTKKERG